MICSDNNQIIVETFRRPNQEQLLKVEQDKWNEVTFGLFIYISHENNTYQLTVKYNNVCIEDSGRHSVDDILQF